LDERWRLGFAANAPFGLGSEYDGDWVGRYHTIKADLVTINLNPSVAFRVSPTLSIGAGASFQYLDVELINAVDLGSLLGAPQGIDGRATLSGTSWGTGYNFGFLYEPSPRLRIGLTYRSRVLHTIDGKADFVVPPAAAALTAAGLFLNTGAHAKVDLPETASLSGHFELNDRWAVLGDMTYTRWSRIRALDVSFDNPLQPPLTENLEWRDTLRVSVGAIHRLSDRWKALGGIAIDPSPVSAQYQRPRLLVGDRVLVGTGLSYSIGAGVEIAAAYMHSFSESVRMNLPQPTASGNLVGDVDLSADLFSLRGLVRF
jgi:long-chain fatty acid transport protein